METQINHSNGSGNWIAFLFGAMFNILANFNLWHVIDYAAQAITGGLVCLLFKILGDFLSPLLKSWWKQFIAWLKAEDSDRN
ncbi:MAG TPA: hypothetical protein PK325_01030 [Cyclobacteriaceae bacterium]|nr:hypothetical protein [Cyclobacteriaceae bacterium]HMV08147.1 hypothetical protein [Cyclobacteriaceae bacterium]HMX00788.1 hypothetical protein [Cyclobacteriaceae bacterium]HMX49337.1 hypothetical protein [Cyclobacteriaceae bacterium]HMY93591.1 hypothetical protein [Cyclobacteriaceae bacterium]